MTAAEAIDPRRLTVHTAQLLTATVEIKTLTVSGRQVTQAVFRQLQDGDLLDESGCEFLGVPWGRVNYHPDKCTYDREHHHVVWQSGEDLRRATVKKPHYDYPPGVPDRLSEPYLDIAFVYNPLWRPKDLTARYMSVDMREPGLPGPSSLRMSDEASTLLNTEKSATDAQKTVAELHPAAQDYWVEDCRRRAERAAEKRAAAQQVLQDKVTKLLGHSPTWDDAERAGQRICDLLKVELRRREREAQNYRTVCDLPQLFIAV